jgi:hypothetical protein
MVKLRVTFGQIASIPRQYAGSTYFVAAAGAEGYGPAYDAEHTTDQNKDLEAEEI